MATRLAALVLAAAVVACGGSSTPAPAAPSNDTVAEPAPPPPPPPPAAEPPPRADGRPAIVNDEMAALAEEMIRAMEVMGTDLTAAGTDCAKGATALRGGMRNLEPIAQRAKVYEVPMSDPAAEDWFKQTYMPRLMNALGGLMTLAQACSNDQDFAAAMKEMDELDL